MDVASPSEPVAAASPLLALRHALADPLSAAALKLDLVDVKIAAIDDIWSGLKLVIRKERRH